MSSCRGSLHREMGHPLRQTRTSQWYQGIGSIAQRSIVGVNTRSNGYGGGAHSSNL